MFICKSCDVSYDVNSGSSDFFIDPLRFGVGEHILDVTIATEFGQVLNIPGLAFEYEG